MTEPAPGAGALELRAAAMDGPEALGLLAELQEFYVERYGGRDETPVAATEFAPPTGGFWIAVLAGRTVGCAGLRRHDADSVELKRMYVRPAYRRRGLARAVLLEMERRAAGLGYRQLVLETGSKQPEALGLYRSSGYLPLDDFGHYHGAPGARAFVKTL